MSQKLKVPKKLFEGQWKLRHNKKEYENQTAAYFGRKKSHFFVNVVAST